jgi:hypothetical protein
MKRYLIVPVVASLLLGGVAVAQSALSAEDTGAPPAATDGSSGGWHGPHHRFHRVDPLAKLQKPLTADAVKQALTDWFARRPQVQSVVDKDANTLLVTIVDPEGKTRSFELNKTTGARRPAW